MADMSVTTDFFASEKEATTAIARLEKKYEQLEGKMLNVGRVSRRANEDSKLSLESLVSSVGAAALAYSTLGRATAFAAEKLRDHNRLVDEAGRRGEDARKETNIASGFKDTAFLRKVQLGGLEAGMDLSEATGAARHFDRAGLPADAAKAIFEGFQVTNVAGKEKMSFFDYSDLIGDALNQAGLEANAPNIDKTMRQIFSMVRGTELGKADFDAARETLRTLAAGKGKERHGRALARLGLRFEDVDLTGETQFEALDRINEGLSKLVPADRPVVLRELGFSADQAQNLTEAAAKRNENLPLYDRSVREITSGRAAAERRLRGTRQLLHETKAGPHGVGEIVDAANLAAEARGIDPIRRGLGALAGTAAGEYVSPKFADKAFAAGVSFPKIAAGLGMAAMPGGGSIGSAWEVLKSAFADIAGATRDTKRTLSAASESSDSGADLLGELRKMNESLNDIRANTGETAEEIRRRPVNRNPAGVP